MITLRVSKSTISALEKDTIRAGAATNPPGGPSQPCGLCELSQVNLTLCLQNSFPNWCAQTKDNNCGWSFNWDAQTKCIQ